MDNKFWSEEKKQVAKKCEDKNTRLYWDNLQAIYIIVKKYPDGSILHTKETEIFRSSSIQKVKNY